jgi:membrane dipeptidase
MAMPRGLALRGAAVHARGMIIDMHTHAGRRGLGPVDPDVLVRMRPAGIAAAVVAAVADAPLIRRDPVAMRMEQTRAARAGECLQATTVQLNAYQACGVRIAREPAEIRPEDPAIVLAIEGGDFLEGDLDRLDAMAARGVRCIQPVHYVVNELGDIQTEPEVHGGMTRFVPARPLRGQRTGRHPDRAGGAWWHDPVRR